MGALAASEGEGLTRRGGGKLPGVLDAGCVLTAWCSSGSKHVIVVRTQSQHLRAAFHRV